MRYTQAHTRSGFTLVELLVVISIIAIFSATLAYFFGPSISRGNDSRRIQDIEQLQTALELYYRANGHFPISTDCLSGVAGAVPNAQWCNSVQGMTSNGHWIKHNDSGTIEDDVLAPYIAREPTDPQEAEGLRIHGGTPGWMKTNPDVSQPLGAYYYYSSGHGGSGQYYMLAFRLGAPDSTNVHPLESRTVTACDGTTWQHSTYDSSGSTFEGTSGIRIPGQINVGADCR